MKDRKRRTLTNAEADNEGPVADGKEGRVADGKEGRVADGTGGAFGDTY
jgi:hypothetical protein